MYVKRQFRGRIAAVILAIMGWIMLANAASSFATGSPLEGGIEVLVGMSLVAFIVDGRVARFLEGRAMPLMTHVVLFLIVLVVIYGGVQDLVVSDTRVLNELYLPGVISLVRGLGAFLLAALLLWELLRGMRRRA